jgi:hypothetical protein
VFFSGLVTDYAITTNGAGHTVVTDLRVGSPDGVTELISIETIQYGTAAPALMEPLSPKWVTDNLVQDGLSGTDWADIGLIGFGAEGNFRGVVPGLASGVGSLPLPSEGTASVAPVMRPLDPGEAGQSSPTVGLDLDGGKAEAEPPVMDVLEGSDQRPGIPVIDLLNPEEKPVAHDDVMPDLSPEEIAQIQLVDNQAGNLGQLLTDSVNTDLAAGGLGDDYEGVLPSDLVEVDLPVVSWGMNGFLVLSDGDDARYPAIFHSMTAEAVDVSAIGLDTIQLEEPGVPVPPGDSAEGWS